MQAYQVTFSTSLGKMSVDVAAVDREDAQEAAIDLMEKVGVCHGEIVSIRRAEQALVH